MAFVVIQAAQILGDVLADSLPPWTLTLVTVLSILGFPIAIVLAWAYELTDQGLLRDDDAAHVPTTVTIDRADVEPRSVAVLPFANLSEEPDNEYFSDGIHEDIITSLSRIRDIHVVSRTSVMRYKESGVSVREIAAELRVATVLEGSVRRSGRRVRISAQLIDAVEDRHLWVESYDHRLEDIFEIQSDVSSRIATALAAELSEEERASLHRRPTEDVEAYDLYLKGRHLWSRRTQDAIERSIEYYRRALQRDPSFALAEAGLADSNVTLGLYGCGAPSDVMPRAREAASRALALDPRMGEPLASLGAVRSLYDWDWGAAERDYRHAIELQPNYPVAHHWLGSNLLTPLGRFAEARDSIRRALELDPLSEAIATSLGVASLYSGDSQQAIDELTAVLDVHDKFGMAYYFMGQAHDQIGDTDRALAALGMASQLTSGSPEVEAALGTALAAAGQTEAAQDILTGLEKRFLTSYGSAALLAQIHLGLGDKGRALDLLEQAAAVRAVDMVWIGVRPVYRTLRGEPRFEALLEKVGLAT